jgi:hypothetical protein
VPVVTSVSYLVCYFLCSFRRSRRQSGALAHLINTAEIEGRASFCEPAWVHPNPILEDIGTNQRGSSVFVKKSLSGTEHRVLVGCFFKEEWVALPKSRKK